MESMKVKLTFFEEVLGTASNDKEIHEHFIASKAPDAKTREEEVEAVGADEVIEKAKTVFPKDENGQPIFWDYQIKGFFKDTCGALRKADGSLSSKLKAYKKEIDGLIFVDERQIKINMPEGAKIGDCQRPLRAQTAQGERVSLANSETVPAGASIEFTVTTLKKDLLPIIEEWFDYGKLRGIGQWRNSGKGRFTWEKIS